MKAKALAAIDKIAAKRGTSRAAVIGGFTRAVAEDQARIERHRIERETREAEARAKPYNVHDELRESAAALERMEREQSKSTPNLDTPASVVRFLYADGTPAEWTREELADVQHSLADDLRAAGTTWRGDNSAAWQETIEGKLAHANEIAREHGLPEVHV